MKKMVLVFVVLIFILMQMRKRRKKERPGDKSKQIRIKKQIPPKTETPPEKQISSQQIPDEKEKNKVTVLNNEKHLDLTKGQEDLNKLVNFRVPSELTSSAMSSDSLMSSESNYEFGPRNSNNREKKEKLQIFFQNMKISEISLLKMSLSSW